MTTFVGCSHAHTIGYRLLCMAVLVFSSSVLTAQTANHPVRNVVLVHGAWADGSGWKSVYDILTKDGFNVSIVQEPETSFKDDVEATKRLIAQQDGPCILVAHSYGGAVATEAGNEPSVVGLVYVAAHMPDAGESEADDGKRFPSDLLPHGEPSRLGCWSQVRTEPSIPSWSGGMPGVQIATRLRYPARAMRCTCPTRRRLRRRSRRRQWAEHRSRNEA